METQVTPPEIYDFLAARVHGQDDVLRRVAVAIFKHVSGINAGNLLLIGNSGTGKTTIMHAIREFYQTDEALAKFRAMAIMNANMLLGDTEGEVETIRLFHNLERNVRNLGLNKLTVRALQEHIENATVCIDEVDKISARITPTSPNVYGIAVQNALLTIIGGETIVYDTTIQQDGETRTIRMPLDTRRMLFVCAGAFESLYDQVYDSVLGHQDKRQLKEETRIDLEGHLKRVVEFRLKDYLEYQDLFDYGMLPQFISRFVSIAVLNDLDEFQLKYILMNSPDSPYTYSKRYFAAMGVDLVLTEGAQNTISMHAANNTRVGARALWHVFSRIMAEIEYDPFHSDKIEDTPEGKRIVIDKETVLDNLRTA
ncbi:MAG: AAA family ATPase [Desulfatibacillaceae bacterium]